MHNQRLVLATKVAMGDWVSDQAIALKSQGMGLQRIRMLSADTVSDW